MSQIPDHFTMRYPHLFQEVVWPNGPTSVKFGVEQPPQQLISNVNAVPRTSDGQYVVIQLDDGLWEIPGGTVEPNEKPLDALTRELMEEAGARLESAVYVGAWRMYSQAEKPFRPHLPHPIAYRAIYRCKVTLVSAPQVPESGGEQIAQVMCISLDEAMLCFEEIGRSDLAELYQFAANSQKSTAKDCL